MFTIGMLPRIVMIYSRAFSLAGHAETVRKSKP